MAKRYDVHVIVNYGLSNKKLFRGTYFMDDKKKLEPAKLRDNVTMFMRDVVKTSIEKAGQEFREDLLSIEVNYQTSKFNDFTYFEPS